ncbi:MAG: hypothetical protein ABI402_08665 [Ferruginibacter sp.]
MNTPSNKVFQKVAEQITNNSTGWIGEVPGNKDHLIKGQTFIANEEGDLRAIKVFSNMVVKKSHVSITLHKFDTQNESWGQVLGASSVELKNTDAGKWVSFDIPGPHLNKGQAYGFRIDALDSYIGVGEACASSKQPVFKTGKEWQFTNKNPEGDSFSYISLAFKVEVAA